MLASRILALARTIRCAIAVGLARKARAISSVVRRIGVDPEEVLSEAASPKAKQALKVATSEAVERGVFGAPAFFVGDEMFWGNDRLHFVEAALQQQ